MNTTAIVTIVSNNYLHFARTLMQSVACHHPQADRYCVVVDRDPGPAQALSDEFQLLTLDQLSLPDGDDFLFQYTVLELNTAVKPWALAYLLKQGYQNVLYIDPDIALYRPLDEVFTLLDADADLVLTPHLLTPITDTLTPGELDIRRAGTYNLGFCALRSGTNMHAMLQWWQSKLRRDCVVAFERGVFVDQSWMDLVPGLFANVALLRHPGYNLAYWNIAQRPVTQDPENPKQILVQGQPLVFFHYSGLNPLAPQAVSKHQNRYTLDTISPPLAALINDYCQQIHANGIEHYSTIDYSYGHYTNGTAIAPADRTRFRTSDALRTQAHGQPFTNPHLLASTSTSTTELPHSILQHIYTHFLGRSPDPSGVASYQNRCETLLGRLQIIYIIGTSKEAKRQPGWRQRLLSWPLRHAQLGSATNHTTPPPPAPLSAPTPAAVQHPPARPAPYAGLHAPEPDSAQHGLWVGPQLDLPACASAAGHLTIQGTIDLALLARAPGFRPFQLHIHGPTGLLHTAPIQRSGAFTLNISLPANALATGNQWSLRASSHVVPKTLGLGDDTRQLAWRVIRVSVDDLVLIDSARSPALMAIEQLIAPAGINLVGYLAAELGLGEAVRSLARSCVAVNLPFSGVDVGFQSQNLQRDTALLAHAVPQRFAIDLLHVNADQTAATAHYLKTQGLHARYRIGYWAWEQPQLPTSALSAFAHLDEVWVPSTFVQDAVTPYAPVPVVKIPHAIAITTSPGAQRSQFGLPQDKLLTLVMYDFHSYQYRKNPQAALTAYRQAAAQRTDVALVIKTINGQHHTQDLATLKASVTDLPNIFFIDDFLTRQQTWDLQACCDILLSLHRAEGFGLAPAEMMYLGKPVVATGWSANTDFMTADNSFLTRYQLRPLPQALGVYPAGQLWADADTDHAAWCLTRLFDDPTLRQSMGQRASADIHHQLSPLVVGTLIRQRLSLLGLWNPQLR
ncbi:MAG: glycosyltransferase [Rhodoferax sp.]|nr:glycosyltransferase [Rhodoferax sp.]